MLPRGPRETDFTSPAHHPAVASRIGTWLAVTFTVAFLTGLISHGIQHPPAWFFWPARPVNLYRVTQGLHVISGIASIPLLLGKLWSVFPKLFARPAIRSLPHALERGSVLVLIAAAFFELLTGLFNVGQNYPWRFFFPTAHYAVAWIAVGALLIHLAVKLPIVRAALQEPLPDSATDTETALPARPSALSRRGFLRTTWAATGVAVLATAGATVPGLQKISLLSWRAGRAPQGVPINRTARDAGVLDSARDPGWRLELSGPTGVRRLSLTELTALPQVTVGLPIACVEGWSASATWTGVRVADLLAMVGAPKRSTVDVRSLERDGAYRSSTLPAVHTADPLTLLALRLNGETLDLDHGYPCRIIAPNRPGVLQTKWVNRLAVTA